jgi:non-ribosomal peptide synthetase component F
MRRHRSVASLVGDRFAPPSGTTLWTASASCSPRRRRRPWGRPEDPRHPEFLANSRLEITRSCFRADPDATAILAGREGGSEIRRVTFAELEHLVDRIAGAVNTLGLADDEGVALYMPMTVECVAAYLGVIRAGHHVVSIADSFAAEEVARRVRLGRAGAVITVERFTRGGRDIPLHATVCAAGDHRPSSSRRPTHPRSAPAIGCGATSWRRPATRPRRVTTHRSGSPTCSSLRGRPATQRPFPGAN